jgi:hypothetical protein
VVSGNKDQALFQSVSDDGTRWLFVCTTDDRWTITRNGRWVAVGTSDRPSVQAGVAKFVCLTARPAGAVAACDPMVLEQLNRIEAKKRRTAHGVILTAAKVNRRIAPATARAPSPSARKSIAKTTYTSTA